MALDCYNRSTGRYDWPWPNQSYFFNKPTLRAMQYARRLYLLFSEDPETWDDEQSAFFLEVQERKSNDQSAAHIPH